MEANIADLARTAGQVLLNPAVLAAALVAWFVLVSGTAARVAESVENHGLRRVSRPNRNSNKERLNMTSSSTGREVAAAAGSANGGETAMRAIVQDTYGSTDVLGLDEISRPEIGDDEVLVRVRAAGVDPGVWHLMTGLPYLVRVAGFGIRAPKTRVRGSDVAGTVEAVGADVTRFQPGDEVFGTCDGAFAEYASAGEERLALKPDTLTFEQAAAIATSGFTALQGLRDRGEVEPGQKVLVVGASGGVGTSAVQIAKALGAEVTGVCSTRNVDMVRSIGADHVIDYTRQEFADGTQSYDVILDTAGNRPLSLLRRALARRGTLVIVGAEGGGRWIGAVGRTFKALLLSPLVSQRLRAFISKESSDDLDVLRQFVEAGQLTPVIDRTYPLNETADAVAYIAEGHARGKVVVTV
jgi:NADPH:quinone reductase-like Zn-dependent oxidoreductase